MTQTMTSDLRRTLAALTCRVVWRGTHEQKQWLADELSITPFEDSTTERLVTLAEAVAPTADVERVLHMADDTMIEIEGTYLCVNCLDAGVIVDEHDRWHRCFECNPYEPPEPKTAKRSKQSQPKESTQ